MLWNSKSCENQLKYFRNVHSVLTNHNKDQNMHSSHKLNYGCFLWFGFLTLDWLFPCNTITFQKYFWCLQFSELYSSHWKVLYLTSSTLYLSYCYELVMCSHSSQLTNSMLAWNFYSAHTYILYTKQRKNRITRRGHHQNVLPQ